jgi:methylenetetrahydrofolate reductase (NADPH)
LQTFQQALRTQDFTLTAEIALDEHADRALIVAQAAALTPYVDAIQVSDSPGSQVQVSPLAAAAILFQAGVDPVIHMNCRDRNRLALCSELLGAAALGVSSLLIMRGREFPPGDRPRIKPVYDWGARRLVVCASEMQDANFMIGTIATVFKPDRDWKPEKLVGKADAGAKFVQTQLCFDVDLLRHYMARLVSQKLIGRLSVMVGLAPLPSADIAQWLGKRLRGAVIPAKVVKRLRQAADPEQEGIKICAEMLQHLAHIPGASGANLVCLGEPEAVAAAVKLSGIRS